MGEPGVSRTAFKRIKKFNDDKTEQVWELFREEFARASVAEDGIRNRLEKQDDRTDEPTVIVETGTGLRFDGKSVSGRI